MRKIDWVERSFLAKSIREHRLCEMYLFRLEQARIFLEKGTVLEDHVKFIKEKKILKFINKSLELYAKHWKQFCKTWDAVWTHRGELFEDTNKD